MAILINFPVIYYHLALPAPMPLGAFGPPVATISPMLYTTTTIADPMDTNRSPAEVRKEFPESWIFDNNNEV